MAKLRRIEAGVMALEADDGALTREEMAVADQMGIPHDELRRQKLKDAGDSTARAAVSLDRRGETRAAAYMIRDRYFPNVSDAQLEEELRREGL
jgi:hypothetical protein